MDHIADQDSVSSEDTRGPLLSIVIPVYNEEKRLECCVQAILAFFALHSIEGEVLVVDDGSTDGTLTRANALAQNHKNVKSLRESHRGKAHAVITGLRSSSGHYIGFCDVDLATPLDTWLECHKAFADGVDVAIASREGVGSLRIGEPWYRHVMGRVFNVMTRLLLLPGIHDTQCGFKFFTAEAIEPILPRCLLYAEAAEISRPRVTAFDVELLFIARKLGFSIAVIPVTWTYGAQSKINPITDTFQNLRDVLKVRVNGWRGRYS